MNRDGICRLVIDSVKEPGYLVFSKDWLVPAGLYWSFLTPSVIAPGANIAMDIESDSAYSRFDYSAKQARARKYRIRFSGPGSDGMMAEYYKLHALPPEWEDTASLNKYVPVGSKYGCLSAENSLFRRFAIILNIAKDSGQSTGLLVQQIVMADVWGDYLTLLTDFLGQTDTIAPSACLRSRGDYVRRLLDSLQWTLGWEAMSKSKGYPMGVYCAERSLFMGSLIGRGSLEFYARLKSYPPGLLRDKLLTYFITSRFNGSYSNRDSLISDCLANIGDRDLRDNVLSLEHRMKGHKAYAFRLRDTTGRMVSLDEFKGKVVVLDFFFKGCIHCSDYYNDVLKGVEADFASDTNVVFISISVDRVRSTWLGALYSGKYASISGRNTVNLYTGGSGSEHDIITYYHVRGYPEPILIDGAGNVVDAGVALRHKEFLVAALKKLGGKGPQIDHNANN